MNDKLCPLSQAIERFVPDGASVALGLHLESMIPFAAGHEIIRQRRRDLTLVGPISDILFDQIIGAGCVRRVMAAWVGNVMMGSGYNFRRAIESGIPAPLEMVDHTNFTLALALHAAALGVPFLPTHTARGSTVAARNPDIVEFRAPFTGETMHAVRAVAPDVTIVHAQRADRAGNAHVWGNLGVLTDAVHAAGRVIVLAEEIVAERVIASDPNRTVVPGFLVSAVVEAPFGAHPSPVQGCYNRDHEFYREYHDATRTREGFAAWLQEMVLGADGLPQYLQRVGRTRLDALRVRRRAQSARADFGS